MPVVTVMDLKTGETQDFTCSPQEAVIAAYAQSNRDWNTWDYEKLYSRLVKHGKHTVICGDFSAYECECHPHDFRDWKSKEATCPT